MDEDFEITVPENARQFWCIAYQDEEPLTSATIFASSFEAAVQSMAENAISGSGGDWQNGKITVRDTNDDLMKSYEIDCVLIELEDGEIDADVTINEIL